MPDPAPPAHRYAIYYAAPPKGPLERFGVTWLGRDHRIGRRLKQPEVPGIAPDRLRELTASPRRYGFHGTLKAPFRLAPGHGADELHDAARTFAAGHEAFTLEPLVIDDLKGFLAFVPAAPAARLDALATAAVEAFELFRAPLSEADLARRLQSPLTQRQRDQLARYGYPYVFADFAFHMTLTVRLGDAEKAILLPHLRQRGQALAAEPFVVDAIAVYEEPTPGADFVMTARYGFRPR